MNNLNLITGLVIATFLMGGCATTRPVNADVAREKVAEVAPLPRGALYQALVAEMAAQRGQFDVAADQYQRLARSTRDPRVAERATRAAAMGRDDKKVLELSQEWLETNPRSLDARLFIAAALIRQGQFDAAREHVEAVLAESANTPDHGFGAVTSLLFNVTDGKAALAFMDKLIVKYQDDPYAHYAYGQIALRAEALDAALRAAETAHRLKPDWANAVVLQLSLIHI